MTTPYHARYFAYELTRQRQPQGVDRLSMALFDACVDLNPHQIDAAAFALRSPLSKGVLLADEVGLGKTIEAGLVMCQYWAERKRRLLVICPASLRKQWGLELQEKFNLPTVILDARTGKPTDRKGVSFAFKYLRLESYEDALNNLELKRSDQQLLLLDDAELREQFLLSYMLDIESRGSQSLLNIDGFRNPDQYKLQVERNGETQLVNVDLVETFNWFLGLTVKHIDVIRGVRVVDGTNQQGERVLVLWRNIDELDNTKLDQWFEKQDYGTRDLEYDLIYVNGDNNLENLRRTDQTWKVRKIEEEFKRLMFDVEGL